MSVKVVWRPPIFGDACPGWSHRDLGRATGDERGEDHPEGVPVRIAGFACEQQTVGSTGTLRSGRDARVGRLEAETVPALDQSRSFVQPASQVQEFPSAAASSEASSEEPPDLRCQRRRDKEAFRLEIEDRIHTQKMLVRTTDRTKQVVNPPNTHFSQLARAALRTKRKVW